MAQGQVEIWQRRSDPTVQLEAILLNEENVGFVAGWSGGRLIDEIDPEHPDETQQGINILTKTGMARASLGMYVTKYAGNFFVTHVRPFELVYEPANRPAPPPESSGEALRKRGFADPFDPRRIAP